MSRTVKEWIGKTPDSKIPPRVKARVFEAKGGVCHISGRKIAAGEPWDCDHVVALINGGENRESNLAPALRDKHKAKTANDVAEKAKIARKRAANIGVKAAPRAKFAKPAGKLSPARTPDKLAHLPRKTFT